MPNAEAQKTYSTAAYHVHQRARASRQLEGRLLLIDKRQLVGLRRTQAVWRGDEDAAAVSSTARVWATAYLQVCCLLLSRPWARRGSHSGMCAKRLHRRPCSCPGGNATNWPSHCWPPQLCKLAHLILMGGVLEMKDDLVRTFHCSSKSSMAPLCSRQQPQQAHSKACMRV